MEMCNSPYLIKCLDVYENQDLKIIVMEFCNGGTLESYILERKKIP
jgi:serine/threonine protein kinase